MAAQEPALFAGPAEQHLNYHENARRAPFGTKPPSPSPRTFSPVERDNADCPIRRQVIPLIERPGTSLDMAEPCAKCAPPGRAWHRIRSRSLLVRDRCAITAGLHADRVVSGVRDRVAH